MVFTELKLELCFHGKKLRGFTCKFVRSSNGFIPETSFSIASEIIGIYLLAGFSMVSAGLVMDRIQVCMCFQMSFSQEGLSVWVTLSVHFVYRSGSSCCGMPGYGGNILCKEAHTGSLSPLGIPKRKSFHSYL